MTKRQVQLLRFIESYIDASGGVSPSYQEMADALGLKSKCGIDRLIRALEDQGKLTRTAGRSRSVEVV